eukprot:TRINITY_DN25583_c0_g1_i1.p1 TRINITY_DN25583_c0_g1~~TRINITY_DN25583_c0_g1_i1.p1  ORF type:complete len:393 (+),score=24.57 TRINITY_DN25583_c0_g1_i1:149-1327(+)
MITVTVVTASGETLGTLHLESTETVSDPKKALRKLDHINSGLLSSILEARCLDEFRDADALLDVVTSDTITVTLVRSQTVSTASRDGTVKIWNATTGECVQTLPADAADGARLWDHMVFEVAFSREGDRILLVSYDGTVQMLDIRTGKCKQTCRGPRRIYSAQFAPDNASIVTTGDDEFARIWDTLTGECKKLPAGYEGQVMWAAFSADGSSVSTASGDGTTKIWDCQSGTCKHTLIAEPKACVRLAAFSPDNAWVLTASDCATLQVWDSQTGKCKHTLSGYESEVRQAAFSPDCSSVVAIFADLSVRILDALTGDCKQRLIGHGDGSYVNSAVFSSDSSSVLTASLDGTAKLWDTQTGACMQTFAGHESEIFEAVFSSFSILPAEVSTTTV